MLATTAAGELRLAGVFGDHMVLQRDVPTRVFGSASAQRQVTVAIAGASVSARADQHGQWSVELPARDAGGPHQMRVTGDGELVLADVFFGEVWLCAGQSNMQFPLAAAEGGAEAARELDGLDLRLYVAPQRGADEVEAEARGSWRSCTAADAAELSAVAYFFARDLRRKLGVRIGIVQAAVGGSPAETWTDVEALRANEVLAPSLARPARGTLAKPGALFAGMIAPLAPCTLRGVLWYQGESNASLASQYRVLFPTLIRSWRRAFGREDLAFLYVQLPGHGSFPDRPGESEWAELREAQELALSLSETGRVVTLDLGDQDLHPPRKREIGERLARIARARFHGEPELEHLSPTFSGVRAEGGRLVVSFANAPGGLRLAEGARPSGFAVAGADGRFVWAEARIDGERVILESDEVPEPVAIRYAWADRPRVNLVNAAGLPAAPFRADVRR